MSSFSPSVRALLLGEQKSGKSTRERWWTDKLIRWSYQGKPVIQCCLIFDRHNEREIWEGAGPVVRDVGEFWRLCAEESERQGQEHICFLPRVVVHSGVSCEAYRPFLDVAVNEGDFLIVFCEVSEWLPSNRGQWPIKTLTRGIPFDALFRAGRHIPDRNGNPQYFHFLGDTQEAIGVSPLIRNQSNFVASSALEGKNNLDWVRQNFGRDGAQLADQVQALGEHEWIVLRDKLDPKVPAAPLAKK